MRARDSLTHQQCPSCKAPISLGRVAFGKKVRCPKCRKLISPDDAKEKEEYTLAGTNITDARRSEELVIVPELPVGNPGLKIEKSDFRETQNPYLSNDQIKRLRRYLDCGNAERHISIRVKEGNTSVLLFAEFLKEIFTAAGWRCPGITHFISRKPQREILALMAGTWPFPIEISMIYMALTSAGLDFSSHMDPNQIHEQAVLFVSGQASQP